MRPLALLAATLFTVPLLAAPVPKGIKKTYPLAGTWRQVEWTSGGARVEEQQVVTWEIRNGWAEMKYDGQGGFFVQLDCPDGAGANAVDYQEERFGGGHMRLKTPTLAGVYELDGDTLRLCFAICGERPTDCTPGERRSVYLLTRVRDEKKKDK